MSLAHLFAAEADELGEHYPNRVEHVADGVVHIIGILAAFVGGGVLLSYALAKGGVPLATSTTLYAFCVIAMLAASAVYNLTRPSRARRVLRRVDEAAIFLMIAGSYTPFTMQLLPESVAHLATGAVWAAALAGAAGKVFAPGISDRTWSLVYLGFGWASLPLLAPALTSLPALAIALLAAGGLIYSAGVFIYLNHQIPFRRAIWHTAVVLGAAGHYGAVLYGIVLS